MASWRGSWRWLNALRNRGQVIQLHTSLSFIAGSTTINCSIKIVLIVLITIVRTWALPVQCMALPVRCSSSKLEQDIEDFEDASAAAAEVPIE